MDNPEFNKYFNEKYQTKLIILELKNLFKVKLKNQNFAERKILVVKKYFKGILTKYNI